MIKEILPILEGILFLSGEKGTSIGEFMLVTNIDQLSIENYLKELNQKYYDNNSAFEIISTGQTYKLVTKKELFPYFEKYAALEQNEALGNSSLETLAIIAYNQPLSKFKIEELKGVSVQHNIKKLLAKGLITKSINVNEIGHPNIYTTTDQFLDYIGINSLDELPELKEFMLAVQEKENIFSSDNFSYKELTKHLLNDENTIEIKDLDLEEIKKLEEIENLEIPLVEDDISNEKINNKDL